MSTSVISAAYAEINLNAVRHNLQQVHKHAPNVKVMAVIKANAYGHGAIRLLKALANVDALAVARLDEGIQLRQAGSKKRIAVLQGFSNIEELLQLMHFDLEAVIHSNQQVDLIEQLPTKATLAVWLKIDTGMNRLGLKLEEVNYIHQRLNQCQLIIKPINVMTHLACADDVTNDFTQQQIALFKAAVTPFNGELSIANSAGILAWPDAAADWVRPGIMLYGISPFPDSTGFDLGLIPVMSLYSKLITVKAVQKGETVGYGKAWLCEKATTIGIVAIGYADGYPRHVKQGTPVLVNGSRVPLIGRVSMDTITVDLSTQPNALPGDKVTLWGDGLPIEEIARYADTIPYTLVCGVTQRVRFILTITLA